MFGEFHISKDARDWGRNWYKTHWNNPPAALTTDQFAGYLARKQTHLHKLAMVLSASSSDQLVITQGHMEAAYDVLTQVESEMPRVFARIGQTEITRGSTEILYAVEAKPGISNAELYQMMFRTLSYKDFTDALSGAINSLQIKSIQSGNTICYYPVNKSPGTVQ